MTTTVNTLVLTQVVLESVISWHFASEIVAIQSQCRQAAVSNIDIRFWNCARKLVVVQIELAQIDSSLAEIIRQCPTKVVASKIQVIELSPAQRVWDGAGKRIGIEIQILFGMGRRDTSCEIFQFKMC